MPWYLGDQFVDAIPVVQLMGLATVISGLSTTLVLDLVAAGLARICSIVTAVSAVWHLVTASLAAYYFGAEGVAVAVCGTQLFAATALSVVQLRRRRRARRRSDSPIDPATRDRTKGTRT